MAWYEGLSPCDYFVSSQEASLLKAVGWLEGDRPYTKGKVSEEFFDKLCQLVKNPFYPSAWPVCAGYHTCTLCRMQFTQPVTEYSFRDFKIRSVDSRILLVPGNSFLYVAPIQIAHYIDAHEYQPPEEFRQAAMDCPEMRSVAYLKALLENGGRGLRIMSKAE